MISLLAPALLVARAEKPTGDGDLIGTATGNRSGDPTLQRCSVQCDGLGKGRYESAPTNADYASTPKRLGGITPGGTKPVHARDVEPCPKRIRRR